MAQTVESDCSAGDPGLIPGLVRSAGEGNGNHSSILAWKIAWTEEPGRIQSMGLPRVGHNLADEHTHTISSLSVILLMDIWVASAILAIVNSAAISSGVHISF